MKIRIYQVISIILLFVNSIGALAGGGGLMNDPSGKGNEISLEWLKYTPFKDFFIPGLILFTVNGLFGLVILAMIFFKYVTYPVFIVLQGILLGGWIIIQMMLLRSINFLHITFLSVAIAFVVLGVLQLKEVRKCYRSE